MRFPYDPFLALCLLAAPLFAAEGADTEQSPVTARLIASHDGGAPGETLRIGVLFRMRPGWHLYWRNPGDAGFPPSVAWKLPDGFAAGDLEWPVPTAFGGAEVRGFGYAGDVLLATTLRIPDELRPGDRTTLRADVQWLACRELCLPGEATVTLEIAVREASGIRPSADARRFERARRHLPNVATGWRAWLETRKEGVDLVVKPPQGAETDFDRTEVFPLDADLLAPVPRGPWVRSGVRWRLPLALQPGAEPGNAPRTGVVLTHPAGWGLAPPSPGILLEATISTPATEPARKHETPTDRR